MRILIGVVVVGLVIGGIMKHRNREQTATPAPAVAASASPRQNNEHDWAKNALDRAAEVKRQVAEQRKQNDGN